MGRSALGFRLGAWHHILFRRRRIVQVAHMYVMLACRSRVEYLDVELVQNAEVQQL